MIRFRPCALNWKNVLGSSCYNYIEASCYNCNNVRAARTDGSATVLCADNE